MSIDSVFVHKMWNDHELSKMVTGGVPFPMLSDAGGKVGQIYGVYDEDAGVETRGRFIIDPDGVVVGKLFLESYRERVDARAVYLYAMELLREEGAPVPGESIKQ